MLTDFNQDLPANPSLPIRSVYLIAIMLTITLLTLAGWQWNISFLKRPILGLVAMNPVTAVCFNFSAVAFIFSFHPSSKQRLQRTGKLLAFLVIAIALARLASYWLPDKFDIDKFLYPASLKADAVTSVSNRMAFNTAVCFILFSVSLLLLFTDTRSTCMIAQSLTIAINFIGLFSIAGYAYHVKEFSGFLSYLPMAVPTAICFILLSASLLFATARKGMMKVFSGPLSGAVMARKLIPLAIIIPVILGFLRLFGHWYHFFSVEFGMAILVISIIFFFLCLIYYNAMLLNKRDLINRHDQKALLESEYNCRLLVKSVKDYAIFMVDPNGLIMNWNEGAESIKGYTANEVIGKNISIFYEPEARAKHIPAHNLEMAKEHGHFSDEGWRIRKDGKRFWADIVFTPIYDDQNNLKGFTKITRDITERKRAREQIAYQARLMEDTTDAIISTNSDKYIATWNKGAEKLYGFTAAEVVGQKLQDVVINSLRLQQEPVILSELSKNGFWKGEVLHLNKKGDQLSILVSISATRDDEGKMENYILVCKDITERVAAEQQLKRFNTELAKQVTLKTAELRSVFERVSDGIIGFDKKGQITYVNKKCADLNKRSAEDLIGKNFWVEFPSAANNEFGANFHRSLMTQQNIHWEMYSPSLELWIECFIYPSADGLSLFFRDVTGQIKAAEMLRQTNSELRQLSSHLQNIREEERKAMAREIHDELGQQLTGLKMDLSWINKKIDHLEPYQVAQKIKATLDLLDITIQTVRKIATDLRPSILDDLGIVAAMEWQSQEFEKRSGIHTSFSSDLSDIVLPPDMTIGLFRICQESLTNVARHSCARNVFITLSRRDENIVLTITDDGIGFGADNSKAGNQKTLGLMGMKERARIMGGELKIEPGDTRGMRLEAIVPIEKK